MKHSDLVRKYLFRLRFNENPKYELRIFGIPMLDASGSRKTMFGLGDKLNALLISTKTIDNITAMELNTTLNNFILVLYVLLLHKIMFWLHYFTVEAKISIGLFTSRISCFSTHLIHFYANAEIKIFVDRNMKLSNCSRQTQLCKWLTRRSYQIPYPDALASLNMYLLIYAVVVIQMLCAKHAFITF